MATERNNLLGSIATTMADYRKGDWDTPTPDHVDCWIQQFDENVQVPILNEMDHVLKKTYFSRKDTKKFINCLFSTEKFVGDNPCAFWRGVKFLDIQGGGNSQTEMLALFNRLLRKKCKFDIANCGTDSHTFIYLDDAVFTGNRVRQDIEQWIASNAPARANLHIITIALHTNGHYYAKNKIREYARGTEKDIKPSWWYAIKLENQRTNKDISDVLWPIDLPDDEATQEYVNNMTYGPTFRNAGQIGGKAIFSNDTGRQLLEQEFLKAGIRIRQMCPNLGDTQRPLGHATLETLGFGSLIVTFRNCPNNAPLALWAGDPWYPLFRRITN